MSFYREYLYDKNFYNKINNIALAQNLNSLLNFKIEANYLNQNFLIAFEKFKRIYQKFIKNIDNEYNAFLK